jgi:DNA-binding MarR family transcriptional regulator
MGNVRKKPRAATLDAIQSLQRLTDLFRERRLQLARTIGLSEAQWRLLEEIAGEAFMPSMFAKRQNCSPAAVSRTLRQLQDRELVAAQISQADARQRIYSLTAAGRRMLDRLNRERAQAIEAIWEPFSANDLERFTHFATRLGDDLETYRSREG